MNSRKRNYSCEEIRLPIKDVTSTRYSEANGIRLEDKEAQVLRLW